MKEKNTSLNPSPLALLPFLIFVIVFIGSGIYFDLQGVAQPFYQLKAPYAVLIAIGFAFLIHKRTVKEKATSLIKGCLDLSVLQMCGIFLLAGAFSVTSASIGAVDSISNLCFNLIPVQYLAAGVFILASVVSISMGTSVGTIVAIAPLASDLAEKAELPLLMVLGALVGGALFGDNLSYISDTTVAATKSQNVKMSEKFKVNIFIALPAAVLTIVLLIITSSSTDLISEGNKPYELMHILPFLIVFVLAISGLDVMIVLGLGTLSAGIIGLIFVDFSWFDFGNSILMGLWGNLEISLLVFFTGGLGKMVADAGGLNWISDKVFQYVKGKKSAQFGIAASVFLATLATANNTIAILINGEVAKTIAQRFEIEPKISASILDIFACVAIGFLPYGAILLSAASNSNTPVSPMDLAQFAWYPALLGIFSILAILKPQLFFLGKAD